MNTNYNAIKDKSTKFAIRIIKLCHHLYDKKFGHILSNQLIRCGTSIGANVRESENGASKKDFANKMLIALKEANETQFWLEILLESEYLTIEEYKSISRDCDEIVSILVAIVKTSKKDD